MNPAFILRRSSTPPVTLLSASINASAGKLTLTFSRPVTLVGDPANIYLTGNYRDLAGASVVFAGNVATVTLDASPVYSDETFTLYVAGTVFQDSSGNFLPEVDNPPVTNNSTAPYLPNAVLNADFTNAIVSGRAWISRTGTGTKVTADGDPIGYLVDDVGVVWIAPSDPGRPLAADMGGGQWEAWSDGIDDGLGQMTVTLSGDTTIGYNATVSAGSQRVANSSSVNALMCHRRAANAFYVGGDVRSAPCGADDVPAVLLMSKASGGDWRLRLDADDTDIATSANANDFGTAVIATSGFNGETFSGTLKQYVALAYNPTDSTDRNRIANALGA